MELPEDTRFHCHADPDMPGWHVWEIKADGLFDQIYRPIRGRAEGPGRGRVRCWPGSNLGNYSGKVHGGAILGFVDLALFCGATMGGAMGALSAVTLECSVQFIGGAEHGRAIDAVIDVMRETRRLIFLRGEVVQEEELIASFVAIIRKMDPPRDPQ